MTINNKDIEYILQTSKKAKNIRLSIYPDRGLVATKPARVSEKKVENFIIKKADWILSKLEHFKDFKNDLPKSSHKDFLKSRGDAYKFVKTRIEFWNATRDFKFSKINIRNQKTRWGSCSKNGNLSFNYKILTLPPRAADYIIVHELCHLKEFNHSSRFWALVGKFISDYKEIKRELRGKGLNYY
ncbi:MAG: SprT family zinc-dependent metalloprotease [bacterium]